MDHIQPLDLADNDDDIWALLDNITDTTPDKESNHMTCESQCINCGQESLIESTNDGHLICEECGVINQQLLNKKPEWNAFGSSKDGENGRLGCPTNYFLPKSSLGTSIGGNSFSRIKRLQDWGKMPYKERSLWQVMKNIEAKCVKYNITKAIIDNAKILYKNISDSKHEDGENKGKHIIIRGMNREGLIAACVYFGCKLQGNPRSPKEIADIFEIKITKVTKGCRKFLDIMRDRILMYNLPSSQSTDFIERACRKLQINSSYTEIAHRISDNVNKLDLASDHQPPSVAAGSILLMSEIYSLDISKKNISDTFKITEVTIFKTYKKIAPYGKILISDEKTDKAVKMLNKKYNIPEDEIAFDQNIFNDDGLDNDISQEYSSDGEEDLGDEYEYVYEYESD